MSEIQDNNINSNGDISFEVFAPSTTGEESSGDTETSVEITPKQLKEKTKSSRQSKKSKKKKTINLGLGIFMIFTFIFFAGAAIFSYKTLDEHGSQLFMPHYDIDLPDYIGQKIVDILASDENPGLQFTVVEEYNAEYPEGYVFSQTPKAPKTVKDNAKITLYVSKGVQIVEIPDLFGYSYGDAVEALSELNLIVVRKTDESWDYDRNTVTKMEPEAGTEVEAGTNVTIYVSAPKTSIVCVVPDIVGMDYTKAKSTLGCYGLKIGTITEVENYEVPTGSIIEMSLTPGSKVSYGTKCNITIGKGYDASTVTFFVETPYKNASGSEVYDLEITDAWDDRIAVQKKANFWGYNLTRTGSATETIKVNIDEKLWRVYQLNYLDGSVTILEDYSDALGITAYPQGYTVTVNCGIGGSCSGSPYTVYQGRDCVITITPEKGYEVTKVICDSTDVTAAVENDQYKLTSVTGDHEITVEFTQVAPVDPGPEDTNPEDTSPEDTSPDESGSEEQGSGESSDDQGIITG